MAIALNFDALFSESRIPGGLTVNRTSAAVQNSRGGWDRPPPLAVHYDPIAVHNISGKALLQVSEAQRTSAAVQLYTQAPIYKGDVLVYNGVLWLVLQVADYALQGGAYIGQATLQDPQS
jgi:hypothetical protein